MTLVVARIHQERIAIVSDTLVTEHDVRLPYQSGVIKTCMLPGDVCVSFSNSPELAATAFRAFAARYPKGANYAEVVAFFEESSAATGNDYIVAFFAPPKILKIAGGKRVKSIAGTLWIGDSAAYTRFREYEKMLVPRPEHGRAVNAALFMDELEKSPASDLYSTMRNLLGDVDVPSVGGFACVVSNRDNGFRHSVYCDILYNWPEAAGDDFQLQLDDPIDFGASGENAGYSIAQISAGYMGVNLVAFYLLKAKKLFLFHGQDNGLPNKCTVFDDTEATHIKHKLNEFVGFNLNWLVTVASAPEGKEVTKAGPRPAGGPQGVGFPFFVHENSFPKSR